jgi:acetyl-CoA C-acetyltransferase
LKPAFTRNGTVTAGNSSSISDGASALLLASGDWVRKHNARPIAKIIGEAMHAHEPEWFTTAPVGAVQKLLKKVNWTIDQVDLFEINEAFAVVVLAAMKELGIPRDKVNVFGGACALGHPIGSSGSRILVTLIHALRRKNVKRGIATLCIGGGEALAVAVEIVSNPVELSKL